MKNSAKDFIFGDGNTMNHMFRQFSMGAIAMAVMQAASAQVSITNIVPMQIPGQGTEIRVMFNGCHHSHKPISWNSHPVWFWILIKHSRA